MRIAKAWKIWRYYSWVIGVITIALIAADHPPIMHFVGAMFQSEGTVGFWKDHGWSTYSAVAIVSLYGNYVLAVVLLTLAHLNDLWANRELTGKIYWVDRIAREIFPMTPGKGRWSIKLRYLFLACSGLMPGLSWFGIAYGLEVGVDLNAVLAIVAGANVVKNTAFAEFSIAFGKWWILITIVGLTLILKLGKLIGWLLAKRQKRPSRS